MEQTNFTFTFNILFFLTTSFSFISLFPRVLHAGDTITFTQSLTNSHTLVSSAKKFELGFFTPASSTHTYLGIWYKYIPNPTIIWVANRDNPLVNSTGTLKFSNDRRNLVILNHRGSTIWSSSTSISPKPARKPVAQLLDSGNLVLKDLEKEEEEDGSYVWQSFDYPSDTLLPGMRLGWNFKTGLNRKLTSWRSNEDPSSGEYEYSVDPRGLPQLLLYKGKKKKNKKKVFRSGPWFAQQFKSDPVLMGNPVFKPIFVSDSDEVYYSYEIKDNVTSRFVLTQSGLIQHYSWNDLHSKWVSEFTVQGGHCDDYGICGAFGSCSSMEDSPMCKCLDGFEPRFPQEWKLLEFSKGCVRKDSDICGNNNGEGLFKKLAGMKLPDSQVFHTNSSMSIEECEAVCLKNCSCVAFAKLDIDLSGKGCVVWFGDLLDITEVSDYGQDLYIRVSASELGSNADDRKRKKLIIIPVVASVTSAMLVFLTWLIITKWRKNGAREPDIQLILNRPKSEVPSFEIAIIEAATNNFSVFNKIGEGGFGPVYKVLNLITFFPIYCSGYMPPEYALDGHFSFKSDVFSFGVLLLELLSGKKNKGFFHPDHKLNLLGHAWKLWIEEKALEVMDPLLEEEFCASMALRCIQVGLSCVQQNPEDRPKMSQVVLMLDSDDESVFCRSSFSCLLRVLFYNFLLWLAFLVVVSFLAVVVLVTAVSRVDLLARDSISEESLRSFANDCPTVDLGKVTYESLVYHPEAEDFFAALECLCPLLFHWGEGIVFRDLLKRVKAVNNIVSTTSAMVIVLPLFLENPFTFSYCVVGYPFAMSLLSFDGIGFLFFTYLVPNVWVYLRGFEEALVQTYVQYVASAHSAMVVYVDLVSSSEHLGALLGSPRGLQVSSSWEGQVPIVAATTQSVDDAVEGALLLRQPGKEPVEEEEPRKKARRAPLSLEVDNLPFSSLIEDILSTEQ
ncbi:G-type lectin S-receptor-like serine/threonine-protein kinase [Senna tora]|uniref:non-specific serine/threonine protein kinase n=1 Tax=Senna tora TaxID=362788 RepID=A0A834XAX0_9FABA|nr:G-type lectin S-receptor-like serine/threonine-protein kinase [Senna tora]